MTQELPFKLSCLTLEEALAIQRPLANVAYSELMDIGVKFAEAILKKTQSEVRAALKGAAASPSSAASGGADTNAQKLGAAIAGVAQRLGIYNGEVGLTGPDLLQLLADIESCAARPAVAPAQDAAPSSTLSSFVQSSDANRERVGEGVAQRAFAAQDAALSRLEVHNKKGDAWNEWKTHPIFPTAEPLSHFDAGYMRCLEHFPSPASAAPEAVREQKTDTAHLATAVQSEGLTGALLKSPVAWRRDWDGDVSDEGHWIYTDDEGDTNDGLKWQPLFIQPPTDEEIRAGLELFKSIASQPSKEVEQQESVHAAHPGTGGDAKGDA